MARVKTFTNGGSLLPGDLNSIEDDYEYAFSTYKDIGGDRSAEISGGLSANTYLLDRAGDLNVIVNTAAAGSSDGAFYLDPADRTANTRANKYRLRVQLFTNSVAPAMTFTVGLYPIATYGGGSGAASFIATLGAVTTGSTIAFASPGASSQSQNNSGDFTAPAAGFFGIAVTLSANMAANSIVTIISTLQLRQV